MLEALVQNEFAITIRLILDGMRTVNGGSSVVTLRAPGDVSSATYAEVAKNADRLAAALATFGVQAGDRIATMCWNTQEHLEAYLAVPCMGAVVHTLNLRLTDDEIVHIVNHARDRVLIVEDSVTPVVARVASRLTSVEYIIVVGTEGEVGVPNAYRYSDILAAEHPAFVYPEVDERSGASLCYTSGTTGMPRGVLYGHRSTVLHSLAQGLASTWDIRSSDRVLPIVPMYHANAWGLPYTCAMLGADLVMPGRFLQGAHLVPLIRDHGVTLSAGVPTVLMDLAAEAERHPGALGTVRKIWSGGSAVPRALMERYENQLGVEVVQGFGMTETSPLVAIAEAPKEATGEARWSYRTKSGRLSPLVEARIVDVSGEVLPWDGVASGELHLRGPWIASGYYENPEATADRFVDGWLKTGDIATIDPGGYLQITDRVKDVIKSGGEWISSLALEDAAMKCPGVAEAAVIAQPHERWSERPLACVVALDGSDLTAEILDAHLQTLLPKWWLPDGYTFLDALPRTSVGKVDKKALRLLLSSGSLRILTDIKRSSPSE